uniref:CCHC-type domain-containing protein n=1 Tax=Pelusios castaneus TaxID=367368 RepID=A0A8C8RQH4_9SAUR
MGGGVSKGSPLDLMLKHFKEAFGPALDPDKLTYKCQYSWPALGPIIDWPPEGSLDLDTAGRVQNVVIIEGQPGCPKDIPYIESWIRVLINEPPWIKSRVEKAALTMMNRVPRPPRLRTPAICPSPTRPPATQNQDLRVSSSTGRPENTSDSEESDQVCLDHNRGGPVTQSQAPKGPSSSSVGGMYPVRQVMQVLPPSPGSIAPRTVPTYQYSPFTTSDLLNWKTHYPSYTDKPGQMIELIVGLIGTHNPTWDDVRQLMFHLLTTEERNQIIQNMEEEVKSQMPAATANEEAYLRERVPRTSPPWNINTEAGRQSITEYQARFLRALRKGKKRPINITKVHEILQKPDESPEAPESTQMINMAFVSQSAPDIRRKLQKLEGFEGMNLSQLKAVADKVYMNREIEEKRESERKMKRKAELLAAALDIRRMPVQGGARRNGPLGRNQCAYCKQEGHWKQECPQKPPGPENVHRGGEELSEFGRPSPRRPARPEQTPANLIGLADMNTWDGPISD